MEKVQLYITLFSLATTLFLKKSLPKASTLSASNSFINSESMKVQFGRPRPLYVIFMKFLTFLVTGSKNLKTSFINLAANSLNGLAR